MNKAKVQVHAGDRAFEAGNYSSAIDNYTDAAKVNPDLKGALRDRLAEAYCRRGQQAAKEWEDEKAIADFERALDLKPGHAAAIEALEFLKNRAGRAPTLDISRVQGPNAAPAARPGAKPANEPYVNAYQMASGEGAAEPGSSPNRRGIILLLSAAAAVAGVVVVIKARKAPAAPPGAEPPGGAGAEPGPAGEQSAGAGPVPFDRRVRGLMDAGHYGKALAAFASKDPSGLTEADRISLFEIHLRLGNVDGARMVFESVRGSRLLAENPALCGSLGGLCAGIGLGGPAAELAGTKATGGGTELSQAGSVLAGGLDNSQQFLEAVSLAGAGKYEEALAAVLKKPRDRLTLGDHGLLFEIYLRRRDYDRAELMLRQLDQEAAARHPVKRLEGRLFFAQNRSVDPPAHLFCAAMARVCREKGRADFASRLCRLAVDCLLTSTPVREKPGECYRLALSFEADGEKEYALELYGVLAGNNPPYKDSGERCRRLEAAASQGPVFNTWTPAAGIVLGGRYELRGELGSGGMGVVYEGADRQNGSKVAVKRMHSSLKQYPKEYERFVGEAKIVERLKHPNIVSVRGVVEQAGETYLVFDYVSGRTLAELLKEKQRLPLDECRGIFRDVCEAVHYAHKNNIIHRDLKPANIMLTGENAAKVMDFGLASELRESMTRLTRQTMSGTPAYMAPEQHEGLVKRESDIYAMGVCLYEMLAGKIPFDGHDFERLKKAKSYREISAILPWLPGGVDKVIDRALDPEPSQRYADALDFYAALKNL